MKEEKDIKNNIQKNEIEIKEDKKEKNIDNKNKCIEKQDKEIIKKDIKENIKEKCNERDINKVKNIKNEKNEINIIEKNELKEVKLENDNMINNDINNKEEIKKENNENNLALNNNNSNQEMLKIFKEIKQINQEEKENTSSSEEENIININNDINKDINNINININNKNPKKIEIIENYFDFHMHDIDLVQIESYYKTYKNVSENDSKLIKLIFEKYNKFISENLNQTTYPYLINSIKPHFQTLDTELKQKFFLIQILSGKNSIKKKLFHYFKNLTQINLYGVSDKLRKMFNKEVFENKSFDLFSEKLSKWHCHVEMIVLYLDILSNLFNEHFDFNKQNFSLEKNFKSNTDILIKKNFYKLAGKLCSKISLNPGIDYQKLITFALTIVTTGIGGAAGAVVPLTVQFSQQNLAKIIGIFGLNFLTQRASSELSSASEMQEFNALSNLVEKLNNSLLKIEKTCYRLIVLELQEELYSNLESSRVDLNIQKKKEEISKLLEKFLKGVECPDDIEKQIEEEYIQLNASIIEEKYDNDWIIQHLSVKELEKNESNQNNDNNKKNKEDKKKDKEKNIFDDFVDINKDDL